MCSMDTGVFCIFSVVMLIFTFRQWSSYGFFSRSFTDGQWYSFNDQQVTKVSYVDFVF